MLKKIGKSLKFSPFFSTRPNFESCYFSTSLPLYEMSLQEEDNESILSKYTVDLTSLATEGKLDPVIGRNQVIRRVIQILSRRWKNNPLLIGEPGVGKTAICEGLALRIVDGDVPANFRTKKVLRLDLVGFLAGTSFRGELEERISQLIKEVKEKEDEIILFIDEIHQIKIHDEIGNAIKPELARGDLHCIGATTTAEYSQVIEKDGALARRFQTVFIDEPTEMEAIHILKGLRKRLEIFYGLGIEEDAIHEAVKNSVRYIKDRYLPDKALDILDEACASVKITQETEPEILDILEKDIVNCRIQCEVLKHKREDSKELKTVENELNHKMEEKNQILSQWKEEREMIEEKKDLKQELEDLELQLKQTVLGGDYEQASLIKYGEIPKREERIKELEKKKTSLISENVDSQHILSVISKSTGIPVEKLEMTEREKLLNMEEELGKYIKGQNHVIEKFSNIVRINKSGLGSIDASEKPIGSFLFLGPTGTGKTETCKAIAKFLFDDPQAILRIDMSEFMEKFNISKLIGSPPGYVGYEEGGVLTEAVRMRPYQVILFDEFEKANREVANLLLQILDEGMITDAQGRKVDFSNTIIIMTSNIGSDKFGSGSLNYDEIQNQVIEELKNQYPPEFLNRIDELLVFNELRREDIREIVLIEMKKVEKAIKEQGRRIDVKDIVYDFLASVSYSPKYGARPLKRTIKRTILNPLSKMLIGEQIDEDNVIVIDVDKEKEEIVFSTEKKVIEEEEEVEVVVEEEFGEERVIVE